jgi:MoxR-like ATPase
VLQGRYYVTVADVKAIAHPVLRHRVVTNFTAEAEGVTSDKIVDKLLEVIPAKEASLEKDPALPKVTGA